MFCKKNKLGIYRFARKLSHNLYEEESVIYPDPPTRQSPKYVKKVTWI